MSIEDTLAERGDRYGSFEHHATIAQELQDTMRAQGGWARLAPDQKQALTVIADKIARMLNGDPAYRDNWHDIVGYAKLVDDRMARAEIAKLAPQPAKVTAPWLPHTKGEGNPARHDQMVDVTFANGETDTGFASGYVWTSGTTRAITHWRPHTPE